MTRRALESLWRWTGLPVSLAHAAAVRSDSITIEILPHDPLVGRDGAGGAVCMTSTFGQVAVCIPAASSSASATAIAAATS